MQPPEAVVHVLALDDDPFIRQMIVDFLGDYDFRVTAVGTGAEMADILRREPVDLLVLDLRLPGEDGLQIARKLREASDLGIIVISGRRAPFPMVSSTYDLTCPPSSAPQPRSCMPSRPR